VALRIESFCAEHMRPRILIVEDQYFVAIDNELTLRSGGFEVVGLATTAKEAIELAECGRPDLVLMDIRLASRADGVEAAVAIYQRFGVRSLFTSGHADEQVREEAEHARPLGWLDKPYTSDALLAAVKQALAQLPAMPALSSPQELHPSSLDTVSH
jgi:DNA-binding NarL/FixJ family response regulator